MADRLNYPEWKAPKEDGQIVVWPEAGELLRETGENQRRLSGCEARVQGVALREVRAAARGFLGHEDGRPLIATGHQAELHHPGVWVKNVLMDAVAGKVGGGGVSPGGGHGRAEASGAAVAGGGGGADG